MRGGYRDPSLDTVGCVYVRLKIESVLDVNIVTDEDSPLNLNDFYHAIICCIYSFETS